MDILCKGLPVRPRHRGQPRLREEGFEGNRERARQHATRIIIQEHVLTWTSQPRPSPPPAERSQPLAGAIGERGRGEAFFFFMRRDQIRERGRVGVGGWVVGPHVENILVLSIAVGPGTNFLESICYFK